MKTLVFEGIATSGKSTVIANLKKILSSLNVIVADESETHEPIMDKTTEKHVEFFKELINKLISEKPDLLIFDRLYLTQAFRAKCSLENYAEIEEILADYSPLTIFLKVDESYILERIQSSKEHRGTDYFRSRGKTIEEITKYYIEQQQNQLGLLKQSKLPYIIFDTTKHNYQNIAEEIVKLIN